MPEKPTNKEGTPEDIDDGLSTNPNIDTNTTNNGNSNSKLECFPFLWELDWNSLTNMQESINGTRTLLILIIIGCLLSNSDRMFIALSSNVSTVLIEAKILKILSSIFLSTNLIWSIIHILSIIITGLLIEPIKGTYSFIVFMISVGLLSELMTLLTYLSMYYFSWDTFYLETTICGLSCIIGALTIAIAEISPQSVLISQGSLKIRCQYCPFLLLTLTIILWLFGISLTEMCLIQFGLYSSWIYLRYFQYNNDTGMKGNLNDQFSLSMLFPPILRIPISLLSKCCYAIFDSVGCCHNDLTNINTNNMSNNISNNNNRNNLSNSNFLSIMIDNNGQSAPNFGNSSLLDDNKSLDPEEQKKRDDAKKQIEIRLAELQKEMSNRAKNLKQSNAANSQNDGITIQ